MKRIALARRLRRDKTDAERLLWSRLRDRRLRGFKFRRQVPIEGCVVDFACVDAKLVIELDGGQHNEMRAKDAVRTETIERTGYALIRFWNHDVIRDVEAILTEIDRALLAEP